jgi:hypothetical protein
MAIPATTVLTPRPRRRTSLAACEPSGPWSDEKTFVTTPSRAPIATPLRRWLAPPLTGLVFLIHPLVSLVHPARQLQDPGIGWHLATGRYILDTHAVPQTDVFSFTAAGHPWVNYYWIFDAGAAALERLGGLPLYATVCMLIYACIPMLIYRRMVRMGSSIVPALLLTVLAYVVLLSHALARPHVVTYLLFAVFLERLDDVRTARRPPRALWLLVPLATLWCNLHGGFLAGLALVGIYAAVATGEGLVTRTASAKRTAAIFLALFVVTIGATGLNPHGFYLHQDTIHHLAMTTTGAFNEFASPNFQSTYPIFAFEILVLGCVVAAARAREHFAWVELVSVVFFLHQALHSVRHVSLFAIVAAPLVAREASVMLTGIWPAFAARWRIVAGEQAALHSPQLYVPALAALFLTLAITGRTGYPRTLDDLQLTRGAAAFIDAHVDRFARPFNTDNLGGALIHRYWPAVHVFFDDRIYVYGDAFVADEYLPVHFGRRDWRETLDRYEIQSAIVTTASPVAALLDEAPDWDRVYEDEHNALFWRKSAPAT